MMEDRLSELPRGWTLTHMEKLVLNPKNDIVDGPFGSNLKASEYVNEGIPIIRLQNVQRNSFIKKNIRFIRAEKARQLQRHNFANGDIVITKLGDPLGEACIVPDDIVSGIIVADVVRVRIDGHNVSKKYLVYSINSDFVKRQLELKTKGTTRPRVNLTHMRKLELLLPPLPEQHRIVAKIEELFTKLDAGVEALKKVKEQLKRYRQAVLKYAFEGRLTQEWREANKGKIEPASVLLEIIKEERKKNAKGKYKELLSINTSELPELPEGWIWTRLELCSHLITKGESPNWQGFNYVDDGIPFIRSENVLWGSIDVSDVARIPGEFHRKLKRSQLKTNDVLVNLVGASIGRCGIFLSDREANINQAVALVRVNEALKPLYLMNLFLSPRIQKNIHDSKVETARPNISLEDLRCLFIPLPTPSEQGKIVEEIESRLSMADKVEKVMEVSFKQSDRLRQSILKQAFEGKLVPQDPTDEPAEKLLERIREEKTKRETENRKEKQHRSKIPKQMELI